MTRIAFVRSAITGPHASWYGAAVTIVTVSVATVARWLLGAAADGVQFVTYFPAIMICALLAGWRYGAVSVLATVAVVRIVFLPPDQKFVGDFRGAAMIALFLLSCGIIIAVSQALRRTLVQLDTSMARSERLNRELLHRVRNSMSIVLALAHQSARSNPTDFLEVFSARVKALAHAHDALGEHFDTCDLGKLVDRSCAPFCHEKNFGAAGPPCRIPSQACIPLTLAIHELCTNATKYGAFSVPDGRVSVEWVVDQASVAKLAWIESGGPVVAAPKRRGLGSALLSSQRDLGKVDLQFRPDGVRCSFEIAGAETE